MNQPGRASARGAGTARRPRGGGAASAARPWIALAALTMVSFLLLLEDTAVSVALPSIRRDLGLGLSGLQWVVNAYTLSLAVLLLPAGRLADTHGRRRVFLAGLAVFLVASLASAAAVSAASMIVARAVQGAGAALMAPAALSLISGLFGDHRRGAALGIWAGASAVGLGLGPVVGALITERLGWSWIFLINLPLGVLAWIAVRMTVPETRGVTDPGPFPVRGVIASGIALLALLVLLTEATSLGWTSGVVLGLFAAAGLGAAVFARTERRAPHPLLGRALFTNRAVAGANVVSLLSTAVMCNLFFFLSLYFQLVLGFTALGAGASLLPLTALIVVVAPLAGHLSDRIGRRLPVVVGFVLLAAALALLSRLDGGMTLATILIWLGLAGAGIGLVTTPITAAALDGVAEHEAGAAAALLNTFRAVGLSLGIATMGLALSAGGADVLTGGGRAREAFVDGLSVGLALNAVIALAAAAIAAVTLRGRSVVFAAGEPDAAARRMVASSPERAYEVAG